jgi:hypothetical protein
VKTRVWGTIFSVVAFALLIIVGRACVQAGW